MRVSEIGGRGLPFFRDVVSSNITEIVKMSICFFSHADNSHTDQGITRIKNNHTGLWRASFTKPRRFGEAHCQTYSQLRQLKNVFNSFLVKA